MVIYFWVIAHFGYQRKEPWVRAGISSLFILICIWDFGRIGRTAEVWSSAVNTLSLIYTHYLWCTLGPKINGLAEASHTLAYSCPRANGHYGVSQRNLAIINKIQSFLLFLYFFTIYRKTFLRHTARRSRAPIFRLVYVERFPRRGGGAASRRVTCHTSRPATLRRASRYSRHDGCRTTRP